MPAEAFWFIPDAGLYRGYAGRFHISERKSDRKKIDFISANIPKDVRLV